MDYFRIEGAKPLSGDIAPMGNKNSALPLLAASVLTDDPLTIGNVPDIGDVRTKLALLDSLGIDTCFENNVCELRAAGVHDEQPDPTLSGRIRTPVLLAGPVLARFGHVKIFRPGGERIGRRRLDTHLMALQVLGRAPGVTGHSRRHGAGHRGVVCRRNEYHPQRRPDRQRLRTPRGPAWRTRPADRAA